MSYFVGYQHRNTHPRALSCYLLKHHLGFRTSSTTRNRSSTHRCKKRSARHVGLRCPNSRAQDKGPDGWAWPRLSPAGRTARQARGPFVPSGPRAPIRRCRERRARARSRRARRSHRGPRRACSGGHGRGVRSPVPLRCAEPELDVTGRYAVLVPSRLRVRRCLPCRPWRARS